MKKILIFICICLSLVSCTFTPPTSAQFKTQENQAKINTTAVESIPIPTPDYFQERRTIAKWTERWDQPGVVTYVYLLSYGNIIGYYVADGKPASTRSYLIPEEQLSRMYPVDSSGEIYTSMYQYELIQAPDIDGTYGENNVGIRFFTAEGTAVEWGGNGATYLYSDAPLPLKVPKLNMVVDGGNK